MYDSREFLSDVCSCILYSIMEGVKLGTVGLFETIVFCFHPVQEDTMPISAWYMDTDEVADQRLTHLPEEPESVSLQALTDLGVLSWTGLTGAEDPRLAKIRADRGYTYTDVVNVCPEKLPQFEEKIKSFYKEHIHYDEEIRYCMDGSGYFDVRDKADRWIRISLQQGDLIVLPEGIYHRFTCDSTDYIQAMRLFVGEPIWTPYNRAEIDEKKNASRQKYIATFF